MVFNHTRVAISFGLVQPCCLVVHCAVGRRQSAAQRVKGNTQLLLRADPALRRRALRLNLCIHERSVLWTGGVRSSFGNSSYLLLRLWAMAFPLQPHLARLALRVGGLPAVLDAQPRCASGISSDVPCSDMPLGSSVVGPAVMCLGLELRSLTPPLQPLHTLHRCSTTWAARDALRVGGRGLAVALWCRSR